MDNIAPLPNSVLVFGASGAIGRFLLPRLAAAGYETIAVSRQLPPTALSKLAHWRIFDFHNPDRQALPACPTVISAGPLDVFVHWLRHSSATPARVVAFSSTSAVTKRDSPDPGERALAARLQAAEADLFALAVECGSVATVLRPTLIYGAGGDRSLSRIAALARRWRCFALPRNAAGLRQPVHADDLAIAVIEALSAAIPNGRVYDLPGGETLTFRDMAARVLTCLDPPPRLFEWPPWLFRTVLKLAHSGRVLSDAGVGVLARLDRNLVFDAAPARRDLGYAPRPFQPSPDMFE